MRLSTSIPALVLVLVLGCGPIAMIPGGEISGTPQDPPSDWSFTDDVREVVLETDPADPYSVTIWGVGAGPVFYIAAGDAENRWSRNLAENPNVRLKVGDDLYELRAEATDDPADLEAFIAAVKTKYDFEPDEEQRAKSQLFRLVAR